MANCTMSRSSDHAARSLLTVVSAMSLALGLAAGCRTRFTGSFQSEGTSPKVWTITADSQGPMPVDRSTWQNFSFTSYGKIKTYLGIMNAMDTNTPEVHLIDTTLEAFLPEKVKAVSEYGTHAAYSFAAGWVNSDHSFLRYLMGARRIIFPFTLYDFSARPIEIEGQRYSFLFQNRRYKFIDKAVTFSASIDKAVRTIQEQVYGGSPGALLAFADASNKRPNLQTEQGKVDIPALEARGLRVFSIETMIAAAGGEHLSVLNPGVAFGELALVKGDGAQLNQEPVFDEDGHFVEPDFLEDTGTLDLTSSLSPRHIVIFEEVPDRVPPVGGIITLEGQTPLSHVNLLAVNRGTPNAASVLGLNSIPGFKPQLVGKLVKFTANADGSVQLEATDPKQAEAWFKRERPRLTLPRPIRKGSLDLIALGRSTSAASAVNLVGAKAANYGKIERLLKDTGVVLPGYASGFDLYLAVVNSGGIRARLINPLLNEKDRLSPRDINARLAAIRTAIQDTVQRASVTDDGQNVVLKSIANIRELMASDYAGIKKIRLRSSTNSEDLPQFNGAGLYTSVGFQRTRSDGELRSRLGEVLASLWLPRAFWEREFFNVDHQDLALGLQINPAFVDEIANGVIVYTRDANGDSYWINSQAGEASVTNPQRGDLPESLTFTTQDLKNPKINSHSNVGNVFLDASKRGVNPARTRLLIQLMEVTQKVATLLIGEQTSADPRSRYGVDIEFKIMPQDKTAPRDQAERLVVKQARLLHLGKNSN